MLLSIEQEAENGDVRERALGKNGVGLPGAAYHAVIVAEISAVARIVTGILHWHLQKEPVSRIKHNFCEAPEPLQDYYKPATSP
jgi:hypothetical protein